MHQFLSRRIFILIPTMSIFKLIFKPIEVIASSLTSKDHAQISRLIAQKEEHGHKVKDEIRVIWGDYIKEPQLEKYPELHSLSHSIMLAASKAKQNVDKSATLDLLEKVNRFSEIFWDSKNIKTFKAVSPYPPEQELVYPDLKN